MWFDDLYRSPENASNLVLDGVITPAEASILARFSSVLRQQYPKGCHLEVVDTNKLRGDSRWEAVVHGAREAQMQLKR